MFRFVQVFVQVIVIVQNFDTSSFLLVVFDFSFISKLGSDAWQGIVQNRNVAAPFESICKPSFVVCVLLKPACSC
jgi:hypothetical protein